MSEGELKKRIQRQFLSNRWSQPSDIFPILDESNQDFPSGVVTISDNKGNKYPMNVYPKEDIDVWFKKWFGEVK